MAITSSFLYNIAKRIMMGKAYSASAGVAINSISITTSIYMAYILESHTPKPYASTSATIKTVFASRVTNAGEHATWGSVTNDVLLAGTKISNSQATGVVFFDANDMSGNGVSVSTGQSIGGLLIYKRVNDDDDSIPIALIDIGSPVTANGATINVNWDNGANRIFSLT